MGPAPGRRPPTPNNLPAPAAKPNTPRCVACETSLCKNGYRSLSMVNYACWCGGDVAPARNLESQIPANEADWDKWVADNNLPKPFDGVDRCCMIHDLELGRLRQSDPSLAYNSNDQRAADINSRLARCFNREKNNMNNRWHARFFASNGEMYFNHLSGSQVTGALATDGADMGYGGLGAGGASSGAMYAFGA